MSSLVPDPRDRVAGRYDIVGELGRGGAARVYLARDTWLGRPVAVKRLEAFHLEDPEMTARFLEESRVEGSLSHPNVVTVHDYLQHGGVPHIVMEFLDGGALRGRTGGLSPPQVAGVLEGVLAGLAAAHRHGVIHRDLKPGNVLLTADSRVKIADFGIAKAIDRATQGRLRTGTGALMGTPRYMAPEQATAQEVGPWTDLYACGVMAYEMLVGRVPFDDGLSPGDLLLRHVHEPIPPPRSVAPDLDPALAEWLEWMLAKPAADRPASAGEAWEAFEDATIRLLGPRWRRASLLDVNRHAVPAAAGVGLPDRPPRPRRRDARSAGPDSEETLAAADPPHGESAREPPEAARRRPRLRVTPVMIALAALALVLGTAIVLDGERSEPPTLGPAEVLPVGSQPGAIAATSGDIWIAGYRDGTLTRIDASTGVVLPGRTPVGRGPTAVAAAGGDVWVANRAGGNVTRISRRTGRVIGEPVRVARAPVALSVGRRWVWTACAGDRRLWRIDPRTHAVAGRPLRVGSRPSALAEIDGMLWVADYVDGVVRRVEPRSGAVTATVRVGRRPWAIAAGGGRLWVANFGDRSVSRIDPSTAAAAGPPVAVDGHPVAVAAGHDGAWIATTAREDRVGDGAIQHLDPDGARTGSPTPGPSALGVVEAGGAIWATDWQHDVVRRMEVA